MKISIIHLSDIHITAATNNIFDKLAPLTKAINSRNHDTECTFIIVTGDIAKTGNESEYKIASKLVDDIYENIDKDGNNKYIILTPGNHDVDFSNSIVTVRQVVIDDIKKNKYNINDKEKIKTCCEVQENYKKFENNYIPKANIAYSDELIKILTFKIKDKIVKFNCLNTSWCSEINEKQGTLYYPIADKIQHSIKHQSDITITIMHHSPVWFESENIREFNNTIKKYSDFLLTGHEHVSSKSLIDNYEGDIIEHLEGSVLQDEDNKISGFNHIVLDLKDNCHKIFEYSWNGELYNIKNAPDKWIPLNHIKPNAKKIFIYNEVFEKFLIDPGANFIHKNKQNIVLEDFYVYPLLKNIRINHTGDDENIINNVDSTTLTNLEGEENKHLVIGSEKSGKSALCKILYKKFNSINYIPVWIRGDEIRSCKYDKFNKVVENNFVKQYSELNLEKFIQHPSNNKVIIIDDIHHSKLSYDDIGKLISLVNDCYDNIIITANELFQIGEIISDSAENAFSNYNQYEILPFGHYLRAKLIEKWNSINPDNNNNNYDRNALIRSNNNASQIVNTIVGHNYIPSYPIFVVIILQGIDAGTPTSFSDSSYGYYYEYLITQSLRRLKLISHDDIDKFYNYLTQLSFYMFDKKISELNESDFITFHQKFCGDYDIDIPFRATCDQLIKTTIIIDKGNIFKFHYKYLFYFFIARYFAHNLSDESIKSVVSDMCCKLYNESNSNIIMFLTHHSKDPFIINELIKNSKSLFSEFEPATLDKDASIVNKLLDHIPVLVLESYDVRENRDNLNLHKDSVEQLPDSKSASCDNSDFDDDPVEINLITKLNLAFRSIEILGQILKNYYASMKGDIKYTVCEESYSVLLRALSSFLEMLNANSDYLVSEIENLLEKNATLQSYKIKETSKQLIFNVINTIIYAFIKKLSSSVGSEKLIVTYNNVLKNNSTNSVKLIDIAIKLDFLHKIPTGEIKNLVKDFSGNPLATILLKQFVIDYLYMFITTDGEKQSICNLLSIPMNTQRLIDYAGKK